MSTILNNFINYKTFEKNIFLINLYAENSPSNEELCLLAVWLLEVAEDCARVRTDWAAELEWGFGPV